MPPAGALTVDAPPAAGDAPPSSAAAPAPAPAGPPAAAAAAFYLPTIGRGWLIVLCAFLSLTCGGTYSYLTNVLLETQCSAECSPDTSFRKPWLATSSVMLVQAAGSLLLAGAVECYERWSARRAAASAAKPPLGGADDAPQRALPPRVRAAYEVSVFDPRMRFPILVVSALDVATVGLQALASLFLPAAINSAMRGTLLLVTALMGRALGVFDGGAGRSEWRGIGVSTLGALGVGAVHVAAAFFPALAAPVSGPGTASASSPAGAAASAALATRTPADAAAGLLLSLASNLTLGLSIVYESRLSERLRPRVLPLNAARSVAASALVLCVLAIVDAAPGRDHGSVENAGHTLCCLATTPSVLGFTLAIGSFATASGNAALQLSAMAGSNFRALIYVGRAMTVWLLELGVFYGGGAAGDPSAPLYGRGWSLFSYPQAVAFALVGGGGALTWRGRTIRAAAAAAAAEAALRAEEERSLLEQAETQLPPREEGGVGWDAVEGDCDADGGVGLVSASSSSGSASGSTPRAGGGVPGAVRTPRARPNGAA